MQRCLLVMFLASSALQATYISSTFATCTLEGTTQELRFFSSVFAGGPCGATGCGSAAVQVNDLEILEADGTPAVLFDAPEPATWGFLLFGLGALFCAWAPKTWLRSLRLSLAMLRRLREVIHPY